MNIILELYNSFEYYIGIRLFHGRTHTLYCGDSDPNAQPGEWYLNGESLRVFSRSYTITDATFDDDGEYQCRRNGSGVFHFTLKVKVYGEYFNSVNAYILLVVSLE